MTPCESAWSAVAVVLDVHYPVRCAMQRKGGEGTEGELGKGVRRAAWGRCVCVCVLKDAQGTRNMDKPSWIIIIDSDIDNVLYCGRTKSISTPMQVSRHPREGRNGGMEE
jgi:hypothetical protein